MDKSHIPKILAEEIKLLSNRVSHGGHKEMKSGIPGALSSRPGAAHDNYIVVKVSMSQDGKVFDPSGITQPLSAGHFNVPKIVVKKRIRRLTEIECERAQGLPDNWTEFGNYDGVVKKISATQRYKLCGNGVSIPVIKMIGEKLKETNYL